MLLACPFSGARQSTLGKLFDKTCLVGRRTAQVRTRLCRIGSRLCCNADGGCIQLLTAQGILSVLCPNRRAANVRQPDTSLLHCALAIQRNLHGNRGRSKVSHFSFHLEVSAAAFCRRNGNANLSKNLSMFKSGGKQRDKEIINRNYPFAFGSGCDNLRAQRQHGGRMIVGGVAVGKVSAYRG